MGATATLSTSDLVVEPGQENACTVLVRNNGELVDQFAVDVVGEAAGWAHADPVAVNLNPGESAEVLIRFAPPRGAEVRAGAVPFGVRVASREDPHGSVVEEGVVTVGAFTDVAAELVPTTAEGSTKAKFQVAVDNIGNAPAVLRLRAVDPEDALDFRIDRPEVVLPPGSTGFVRLQARPRKRFLRGDDVRHPFQVAVEREAAEPIVTTGTMVQRQVLPKWLLPVLIALAVLGALLAALWFTLLKPAVTSAARDAAQKESAEIKGAAQQAQNSAGAAKEESQKAKDNSEQAMKAVGLDPSNTSAPPTPVGKSPSGEPVDFRIAASASIDSNAQRFAEFAYAPPDDKKTLVVTDLILQNPRGDTGTIRIVRDAGGTKTVLLESGLGNFRDLDQHFLQPLRFKPGEKVVVAVSCQNPQGKGNCTPSVSFSGRVE